jgi:cytochrome P450
VAAGINLDQSYLEAARSSVQEPWAVHFQRYEDIKNILQDSLAFTRPVPAVDASPQSLSTLSAWAVFRDDANHRELRRVLIASVKHVVSDELLRSMNRTVARLVDEARDSGSSDVCATISDKLTHALLGATCGVPPDVAATLHRASETIDMAGRPTRQGRELDQAVCLFTESARQTSIYALAAELATSADLRLDPTELVQNIGMLMYGFFGPFPAALSNLLMAAGTHGPPRSTSVPACRAWLHESLRLYSPTAAVDRVSLREISIGGISLRAGCRVRCLIALANRDPTAFERPNEFDAARTNASSHLSFGDGPHACVAVVLYEQLGGMILRALAQRNLRVLLDEQSIEWRESINALGPSRMTARFEQVEVGR